MIIPSGSGWAGLTGVVVLLLLGSSLTWPRYSGPPGNARRAPDFDPSVGRLHLLQVVHRHGARTPLTELYTFGANWTHCSDHYKGVEVELFDENGGATAPPTTDPAPPVLPGGCRQGTLTPNGYDMALALGTWLRGRYVTGRGPEGGFLPDLRAGSPARASAAGAPGSGATPGAGTASGPWPWVGSGVAVLRTTPYRRTIATLRGVLTGLWPALEAGAEGGGEGAQRPARSRAGQARALPVAASVVPQEIMYGNNVTCPALTPLFRAMERDMEAADARDAELPRLQRMVAGALGLDPDTPIVWPKLFDVLAGMQADGAPMPRGATKEVLEVVWAQAARHENALVGPSAALCASLGNGEASESSARAQRCRQVLRLSIGQLISRLLDNMDDVIEAAEAGAAGGRRRAAAAAVGLGEDEEPHAPAPVTARSLKRRSVREVKEPHAPVPVTARSRRRLAQEQAGAGSRDATHPKLFVYSGHDSSVTPLLAVLGQPVAWPPFAASLTWELWRSEAPAAARGGATSPGGRRALRQDAVRAEAPALWWVRILYDGQPLVVPGLSSSGGWIALGVLRQRVLLPYALTQAQHKVECSHTGFWEQQLMEGEGEGARGGRAWGKGEVQGEGSGLRGGEVLGKGAADDAAAARAAAIVAAHHALL
ncbi:hypothetical protein HYH03_018564 [Edaphochlamys debaryana]|uniref:Uncharacterized protein n=1 Tax=Edaphochlamys debaryana TaxID=47281 RepID=A0A835XFN7_9CHLO|nr:hypothetical protein HYH03_018564 [Edaphochlamys debaryana]|eukprot:KAG2482519.1 hypothetical protein HYH03_018564 [Edaphochlamys debaryana]